jgi:hypothetical protein
MRVRLLRRLWGFFAGQVLHLPAAQARVLLSEGIVEEDKSLDGPSEIKGKEPSC